MMCRAHDGANNCDGSRDVNGDMPAEPPVRQQATEDGEQIQCNEEIIPNVFRYVGGNAEIREVGDEVARYPHNGPTKKLERGQE